MNDELPKGSAEYINKLNKIKVLNLIRERKEISRSDIVRLSHLSAPTVTRIVDSLINIEHLVTQIGIGCSSGGRPPFIIKFDGTQSYVIGIDWGRTHIMAMLCDLTGTALSKIDVSTDASGDFNTDIHKLYDLINHLLQQTQIKQEDLKGIGIAVAGYVDKRREDVAFAPNFGWHHIDVKAAIKEQFNVPVVVGNVSHAMAQGELLYGAGAQAKDFILINVGYGIGAGIISRGEIFSGYDGYSGEIGHTHTPGIAKGRKCVCGKYDCIECYSSGRGIEAEALLGKNFYGDSLIFKSSNVSARVVIEAAEKNDPFAYGIISQAAIDLGTSVATMANLFNPALVVMSGGIVQNSPLFMNQFRMAFTKETLKGVDRSIPVVVSSLKGESAALGSVSLIINEILHFRDF